MPTRPALTGTARLRLHLVIYTVASLAAGVRRVWRGQDRIPRVDRTLRQKLAVLGRFLAYHLRTALDPREFFAVDGDFAGRRRGRLDPAAAGSGAGCGTCAAAASGCCWTPSATARRRSRRA